MYFKKRMNWQMPWSTTTLSPRQKQLYLLKSYWRMYRRVHMGLVIMRHSKTSFLMSLSSKDGSKMDSLSRQGQMIFCWIQIPSILNGTMIGQDCLWSPYWADLTVGECKKLPQYEWIDLRWISISSAPEQLFIGFNIFRLKVGRNVWSAPACLALGPMPHMARINRQAIKAVRLC